MSDTISQRQRKIFTSMEVESGFLDDLLQMSVCDVKSENVEATPVKHKPVIAADKAEDEAPVLTHIKQEPHTPSHPQPPTPGGAAVQGKIGPGSSRVDATEQLHKPEVSDTSILVHNSHCMQDSVGPPHTSARKHHIEENPETSHTKNRSGEARHRKRKMSEHKDDHKTESYQQKLLVETTEPKIHHQSSNENSDSDFHIQECDDSVEIPQSPQQTSACKHSREDNPGTSHRKYKSGEAKHRKKTHKDQRETDSNRQMHPVGISRSGIHVKSSRGHSGSGHHRHHYDALKNIAPVSSGSPQQTSARRHHTADNPEISHATNKSGEEKHKKRSQHKDGCKTDSNRQKQPMGATEPGIHDKNSPQQTSARKHHTADNPEISHAMNKSGEEKHKKRSQHKDDCKTDSNRQKQPMGATEPGIHDKNSNGMSKSSKDDHKTERTRQTQLVHTTRPGINVRSNNGCGERDNQTTCRTCKRHFVTKSALDCHVIKGCKEVITSRGKQTRQPSCEENKTSRAKDIVRNTGDSCMQVKERRTTEKQMKTPSKKRRFFCIQNNRLVTFDTQEAQGGHLTEAHGPADRRPESSIGNENDLRNTTKTLQSSKKSFKCKRCDMSFSKEVSLLHHMSTHIGGPKFRCIHIGCKEAFFQKQGLLRHVAAVHNASSRILAETTDTQVRRSSSAVTIDSNVCGDCGVACEGPAHLARHRRTHIGEKPYSCTKCGMGFNYPGNLKRHMLTHTRDKPYRCHHPDCDAAYGTKNNLQVHLCSAHGGALPFVCDLCGQGFTRQVNLQNHLLRHTGEQPFKCDVCGRGFHCKDLLISHMKHKHLTQENKEHRCSECGKKFGTAQAVRQHEGQHGILAYKCKFCRMRFALKSQVYHHCLRWHKMQSSHSCMKCNKKFKTRSQVLRHMVEHL